MFLNLPRNNHSDLHFRLPSPETVRCPWPLWVSSLGVFCRSITSQTDWQAALIREEARRHSNKTGKAPEHMWLYKCLSPELFNTLFLLNCTPCRGGHQLKKPMWADVPLQTRPSREASHTGTHVAMLSLISIIPPLNIHMTYLSIRYLCSCGIMLSICWKISLSS